MPSYINLNRFEYIITYACTSRCIHCCNIGTDTSKYPVHVDPDIAVDTLKRVAQLHDLTSVMTFGGEPLLYPDIVAAIHRTARELGIETRSIITNGYWTKNSGRTKEIARQMAHSGVNKISLSVDAFHQTWIPLEIVIHSVESLLEAGITNISLNPCWLDGADAENGYNAETRRIISELSCLDVRVSGGNVVSPSGGALKNLSEHFERRTSFGAVTCSDLPYTSSLDNIECFCMEPNGDIPVCDRFMLGNVRETPIEEMLESYNPFANAKMRAIIENGVTPAVESSDGYYTLCELCCAGS